MLRPYQEVCVKKMVQAVRSGARRVLLVAPTGSGKTQMITAAQRRLKLTPLGIAHRREIVRQIILTQDRLELRGNAVSVQGNRSFQLLDTKSYNSLFIDEAHHIAAPSYQRLIAHAGDMPLFGATATPYRADGVDLRPQFDAIICAPSAQELADQGYLAKVRYVSTTDVDYMGELRRVREEFDMAEAWRHLKIVIQAGDTIAALRKYAAGRNFLTYCCNVEHAERVQAEFDEAKIPTALVTGRTGSRQRELYQTQFGNGTLRGLINCEIFTEGTDLKNVGAISMQRPVHSRSLYKQIIGRGMRPDIDCVVLDHVGNYMRHGNVMIEDPIKIMENARLLSVRGQVATNGHVEAERMQLHVEKLEARMSSIWTPDVFGGQAW